MHKFAHQEATGDWCGHGDCRRPATDHSNMCIWHIEESGKDAEYLQEELGEEVNVQEAYLREAKLQDVDLSRLSLSDADLQGANLQGSNLAGMKLDGSDLSNSQLSGANFSKASLLEVNFNSANLNDALFIETNAPNAKFQDVTITGSDFTQSILSGCRFKAADIEKTSFDNTRMIDVDFSNSTLVDANLKDAQASNGSFSNCTIKQTSFLHADLYTSDFHSSTIVETNFRHADCRETNFSLARITDCELNHADFSNADFQWSDIYTDMSVTDFGYEWVTPQTTIAEKLSPTPYTPHTYWELPKGETEVYFTLFTSKEYREDDSKYRALDEVLLKFGAYGESRTVITVDRTQIPNPLWHSILNQLDIEDWPALVVCDEPLGFEGVKLTDVKFDYPENVEFAKLEDGIISDDLLTNKDDIRNFLNDLHDAARRDSIRQEMQSTKFKKWLSLGAKKAESIVVANTPM